jgi:DNA-binding MarR family transcriptional regulator
MEHFLRVFQALTATEAMIKRVAREAGLKAHDAWVMLLCGTVAEPVTGAWLARQTGRSRQHVQRSVEELERRGLLVSLPGPRGRTAGWELTPHGRRAAELLDAMTASWMTGVTRQVDLEALADTLERVVQVLIFQRPDGWTRGVRRDHSREAWENEFRAIMLAEALNAEPGQAREEPGK